jgi:predicted AlkP superfamily phosphohydrolase/phosphomutase
VASLDVPKSPRGEMAAGSREVVDWLCHGEDGPEPSSQPSELASALTTAHPVHRPMTCYRTYTDPRDIEAIWHQYQAQIKVRTATILDWWRDQDWDLFLTVFSESHCMGHHAWNIHDPEHFNHFELPSGVDPVKETYRALDRELGELLEAAGPDTSVVVFSLIGMGANNEGTYLLDEILLRLEPPSPAKRAQIRFGARLRSLVPTPLRKLAPRRLKDAVRVSTTRAGLRVYAVQHDATSGAIRLNLKGREPNGLVEPEDYDAVLDELERELRQLTDPEDGRSIVADVVRVREQYPGPKQDIFADLLVVWEQSRLIEGAGSPRIGTVRIARALPRPGNHRPGGWYVSNRSDFAPSGVADMARAIGELAASGIPGPT